MHIQNPTKLTEYIAHILTYRPAFFALIRPQEAYLFQSLKQEFIKGKILDFGCGDGFIAEMIFGRNYIETGLDVAASRIEDGKGKGVYKKLVTYDGDAIPLDKNSFDTVISNCVLEHIPNLKRSVSEIARVTTPGGYFLTGVMTDKWETFMLGPAFFGNYYRKRMRKTQDHFNLIPKSAWDSIFTEAGFKIVKVIPYISPANARWLDLFHYLSIPSLLSYKLLGIWNIWPNWHAYIPVKSFISNILRKSLKTASITDSSALFYVLKKV